VIHYQLPIVANPVGVWPSLLVVAVLGVNTLLRLWQRGATGFLGAWVFIILSPTLVVPILVETAAERRMYLPLAAIVALVIVGGYALVQTQTSAARPPSESRAKGATATFWPLAITGGAALIVAGVFAAVSAHRLTVYDSELTLWQDAAIHQPDNFIVLSSLARALLLAGREQEANAYFERALPMKPAMLQFVWGVAFADSGQLQKAIEHLEEAARLAPDSAESQQYLGIALNNADQPQKAIEHLEKAIRLGRDTAELRRYLGMALFNAGRPRSAIRQLQRAHSMAPDSAEIQQDLSRVERAVQGAKP
jgi:tetratricopeptide (TPR) repeat protein